MGKTVFSKKDEEIIARLSGDIPEGKEPFKVLAEELNLPEFSKTALILLILPQVN